MYKKILVTLDGSPLAEKVLPHARQIAQKFGAELILLHVVRWPPISKSLEASQITEDQELAAREAESYLESVQEGLTAAGVTVRYAIVKGQPAAEIVDYAELEKVDLIAMSTHGRSGLSRWVLGSVAERVLRAAPCPVLLIRIKEEGSSG